MRTNSLKLFSVIAASAFVGVGAVVLTVTQEQSPSFSVADSTMKTGVTEAPSEVAKEPAVAKAVPAIKGPAPLPPEEQGLPG